jgi:hypothetical protein
MNYTEQEITDAYENGTLFVRCLNQVSDDEGIYNMAGKEYEVVDEVINKNDVECWIIECEGNAGLDEIQITKDDKDFELFIK